MVAKTKEDQTRALRGRLHCGRNNFDQQSFSSYLSTLCLAAQQDRHQPLQQVNHRFDEEYLNI